MSSVTIPRLSLLLRRLDVVLDCDFICDDMLMSDAPICFGSTGIGLLGSLEAQFGMLLCLCCVMVVEKELRLINWSDSCGSAIF